MNGIVSLTSLSYLSLLVYRNASDFCLLILFPAILLNSLMSSSSLLVPSLRFSMYNIMSLANSNSFTSFPVWIPFISFFPLIVRARTSKTMLNESREWTFLSYLWSWRECFQLFTIENDASYIVVVQSLSCVHLFSTPWTAACLPSLSFTIWSLLRFISIESMMLSNHLILCYPVQLPPSIFPRIRAFSNESALHIR